MNDKKIITLTAATFIIASLFLAFTLAQQFDSARYWSVAFVAPQERDNYTFTVSNNTPSDTFTYTLRNATDEKGVAQTQPHIFTVPPSTTREIIPEIPDELLDHPPITITVRHDKATHILKK